MLNHDKKEASHRKNVKDPKISPEGKRFHTSNYIHQKSRFVKNFSQEQKEKYKNSKWKTYFARSSKSIAVIETIRFLCNNRERTCFAFQETIASLSGISIKTVYRAIQNASKLGILAIKKENSVHFIKDFPLHSEKNSYIWLGDTKETLGELIAGQLRRTEESIMPYFIDEMSSQMSDEMSDQLLINRKERIKKETKEEEENRETINSQKSTDSSSSFSFENLSKSTSHEDQENLTSPIHSPIEPSINKELKARAKQALNQLGSKLLEEEYPENVVKDLIRATGEQYLPKLHFLDPQNPNNDLAKIKERFCKTQRAYKALEDSKEALVAEGYKLNEVETWKQSVEENYRTKIWFLDPKNPQGDLDTLIKRFKSSHKRSDIKCSLCQKTVSRESLGREWKDLCGLCTQRRENECKDQLEKEEKVKMAEYQLELKQDQVDLRADLERASSEELLEVFDGFMKIKGFSILGNGWIRFRASYAKRYEVWDLMKRSIEHSIFELSESERLQKGNKRDSKFDNSEEYWKGARDE